MKGNKRMEAIEACNKTIYGIEDGSISVSSSLLLCKRIARLVNDQEAQEWLNYEYGGYPHGKDGYIKHEAWVIATNHGRKELREEKDGSYTEVIFTELCEEIEASIESDKAALGNFTTQGFAVSGELALLATNSMTSTVSVNTKTLLNRIKKSERHLSILKSQYYEYALKWQIELGFGNAAKTIYEDYQERVDGYFSSLPNTTLQKLNAIEDLVEDGNPERYSQVVTSCRRLWSETAKILFDEVFPNYSEKKYKTKSGKEVDVSGDHDNNKLMAVIEKLQSKATHNTLVGSQTLYLVDWIEQINNRQSAGVHAEVTREEAMQCIIHTYIALGDILSLRNEVLGNTDDRRTSE